MIPFFAFPDEVRRLIYTTNAIESLNAKIRRAVRTRERFAGDEGALKRVLLDLRLVAETWTMPAGNECPRRRNSPSPSMTASSLSDEPPRRYTEFLIVSVAEMEAAE